MTTVHTQNEAGNRPLPLTRVPFRGGFILAAAGPVDQEGNRPVPLAPFCEALGIDAKSQRQKLRGKAWACEVIITSQIPGDDQARRVFCIPLRALPMWLATIHPAKVAPEARPMLEAFQAEACDVLYRHFLAPPLPAADVAQIAADVASLRAEVRRLARGRRRLSDHDAARVRAYCQGRAEVTPGEVLAGALECGDWTDSEVKAAANLLRALGYMTPRRAGPAISDERARFTRPLAALPQRCALWPALLAARPPRVQRPPWLPRPGRRPCRSAPRRCRRCSPSSTRSPPTSRPAPTTATPQLWPWPCAWPWRWPDSRAPRAHASRPPAPLALLASAGASDASLTPASRPLLLGAGLARLELQIGEQATRPMA